jgi:hypothetical protein
MVPPGCSPWCSIWARQQGRQQRCVSSRTLTRETLVPAQVQEALIEDRQAPAGPMPLWDTPWYHPEWKKRHQQAIEDPGKLSCNGAMEGANLTMEMVPEQKGEQLWRGIVTMAGEGKYQVEIDGAIWPLITLEPVVQQWLLTMDGPREIELAGHINPWGPWLRVNRVMN